MRKIALVALFTCFAFSCEDEIYSTIPWTQVNFQLNLNGEDTSLNGFGCKVFTKKRKETDWLGYGGILVVNTQRNGVIDLRAYDLSCPNEALPNITVSIGENCLDATCPECGAKYSLISDGGAPAISGSKHHLKQYKVSLAPGISGTYIVTN
jgi:hypothetical protein